MEARNLRRPRSRNPWTCSLLVLLSTGASILFFLSIVQSFFNRQVDPQGCQMSMMTPTYVKLSGFDTEHTRFASKYSLYLYREEGVDDYSQENIGLRGAPVLFIPGNAGSYKQVRSLSSEAARYYASTVRQDDGATKNGVRSLDFFTLDFNEDLAAFHGQTLMDQADYVNEAIAYILSLYHDPHKSQRDPNLPDPSSIILIGHSMGGIVARAVLSTSNYQANSVNTIITMSAPHARPPVSFDGDIVHLYKQINDFWRDAYSQKWANHNPLWHVTLISIAGGGLDTIVPSDYASLSSLVPETHGFTVFTSGIPDVWTGMDHLAITWCDQFRKVVVKSLFEVVDVRRSSQTKSRADRMNVFRKWFLTGLEDGAPKSLPEHEHNTLLTFEDKSKSLITRQQRIAFRNLGNHGNGPKARLLPVPAPGSAESKFTLLTNQQLTREGSSDSLEVLFCSAFPLKPGQSPTSFPIHIDLAEDSPSSTRLACKRPAEDIVHVPASTRTAKYAFEQVSPFSFLQYDLKDLLDYQFIAVVDTASEPRDGFVIAEFAENAHAVVDTSIGLWRLLTTGLKINLPAQRPMLTEVKIPALHSSLLAYNLRVGNQHCGGDGETFTPLLRQYLERPHESKWFVNVKHADINLHGIAPYMPPPLRGQAATSGVSFQLWTDPTCETALDFQLRVDVIGSMGKLAMRYRTAFAAFPLLIVALVLRKQFRVYDETGIFMTFSESLDKCLRSSLPIFLLAMTLLATSFATYSSGWSFPLTQDGNFPWHRNSTETVLDFTKNDLLLGSQDTFFWFLVPLFGLISTGACVAVNYIVLVIIHLFSWILTLVTTRTGYIKNPDSPTPSRPLNIQPSTTSRRRIINSSILLLLVSTLIPYQFAFVVACIVQLITCVRAVTAQHFPTTSSTNFFNYTHSILMLMLWILPINAPVLVVWIHNLGLHWLTPFSSHHNVLAVMPFVLLVETCTANVSHLSPTTPVFATGSTSMPITPAGGMIPRLPSRLKHITSILLFGLGLFSTIYGVTYAYELHWYADAIAAWFFGLHFFFGGKEQGVSVHGLRSGLRRLSDVFDGRDQAIEEISGAGGRKVEKRR